MSDCCDKHTDVRPVDTDTRDGYADQVINDLVDASISSREEIIKIQNRIDRLEIASGLMFIFIGWLTM